MNNPIMIIAALLLSAASTLGQSRDVRIHFSEGRTSVTLNGSVGGFNEGNKDYVFLAREGQRLSVRLTSPTRKGEFSIFRTKYSVPYEGMEDPIPGAKELSDWSGTLTELGDYHIVVYPMSDSAATFTLKVDLLPEKIGPADFDGAYFVQDKPPRGFPGFSNIALTTVTFTPNGVLLEVQPSGEVNAHGRYKIAHITINGDHISLETRAVAGVSYQFNGTLQLLNSDDDPNTLPKWLVGQLVKLVNGKKVAEAQVRLEYMEGVD